MSDDLSHLLNHLGEDRPHGFDAVVPPVVQSGNFAYPTVAAMRAVVQQEFDRPLYTRGHNPTVATLQAILGALDMELSVRHKKRKPTKEGKRRKLAKAA